MAQVKHFTVLLSEHVNVRETSDPLCQNQPYTVGFSMYEVCILVGREFFELIFCASYKDQGYQDNWYFYLPFTFLFILRIFPLHFDALRQCQMRYWNLDKLLIDNNLWFSERKLPWFSECFSTFQFQCLEYEKKSWYREYLINIWSNGETIGLHNLCFVESSRKINIIIYLTEITVFGVSSRSPGATCVNWEMSDGSWLHFTFHGCIGWLMKKFAGTS